MTQWLIAHQRDLVSGGISLLPYVMFLFFVAQQFWRKNSFLNSTERAIDELRADNARLEKKLNQLVEDAASTTEIPRFNRLVPLTKSSQHQWVSPR